MAVLKPCRYCKWSVASNAKRCPNCGGKRPYPFDIAAGVVGLLLVGAIVIGVQLTDRAPPRTAKTSGTTASTERPKPPSATNPHSANPFAAGELQFDADRAERGARLFQQIISRHPELGDYHRKVDKRSVDRGFSASIGIPVGDWSSLSEEQRTDLGHFMCRESPINGWSICVGRIDGSDIMLDDRGLTSKEWTYRKPSPTSDDPTR